MFSTSKLFLTSKSKISATGGVITYSGDYVIHTFASNDTLIVNGEGYMDVLVVAGGGSGGGTTSSDGGGGGGAGGLIYEEGVIVQPGLYGVIVGLGGVYYQNGQNSSIFSFTAVGGGRGGQSGSAGASGGSGGGERFPQVLGAEWWGSGVAGQGNRGGDSVQFTARIGSTNYTRRGGGGGGGAGAIGGSAYRYGTTAVGGNGGTGRIINITGTPTYYAGGGAGFGGIIGAGGAGGGGSNSNGVNGLGGGGSGGNSAAGQVFAGGSGIVIVRYLK